MKLKKDLVVVVVVVVVKKKKRPSAINSLHHSLKFTMEREVKGSMPFLDMNIIHPNDGQLSSSWYSKSMDTTSIMNCHTFAPKKYKCSAVSEYIMHAALGSTSMTTRIRLNKSESKINILQASMIP